MRCAEPSQRPLLAQELLLLSFGAEFGRRQPPWPTVNCVVIGALVADLVHRGRVAVHHSSNLGEETIDVIDSGPTGDPVLDRTLHVLGGGRLVPSRPPVSQGLRIWGGRARRRLRTTAKVGRRDIMRWWEGCWTTAEFPELAPTLLCQLLMLSEDLGSVHETLQARIDADASASGLALEDRQVRDKFRSAALGGRAFGDPRTSYVVALCGSWEPTWLRERLCNDGKERAAAYRRGEPRLENDALARAVALLADRWEAQFVG